MNKAIPNWQQHNNCMDDFYERMYDQIRLDYHEPDALAKLWYYVNLHQNKKVTFDNIIDQFRIQSKNRHEINPKNLTCTYTFFDDTKITINETGEIYLCDLTLELINKYKDDPDLGDGLKFERENIIVVSHHGYIYKITHELWDTLVHLIEKNISDVRKCYPEEVDYQIETLKEEYPPTNNPTNIVLCDDGYYIKLPK